jgi:MFS family permease
MDDATVLREQAAETLRSVEGMRHRTIVEGKRSSTFPLIAFGLAALAVAPLGLLSVVRTHGFGAPNWNVAGSIAVCVSLLVAVMATEIHHRRLPVHPAAPPKKQISTGEAILYAIVLIVFGQLAIGLLFFVIATPLATGNGTVFFALYSIAALVQAKRTHNRALGWAGLAVLIPIGVAPFINTDFEITIVALLYGVVFFIAAGLVGRPKGMAA